MSALYPRSKTSRIDSKLAGTLLNKEKFSGDTGHVESTAGEYWHLGEPCYYYTFHVITHQCDQKNITEKLVHKHLFYIKTRVMNAYQIVIEMAKHQIERFRKCDLFCHTEHLRSLNNV